jgi:undecaprenyl-diphosphatase
MRTIGTGDRNNNLRQFLGLTTPLLFEIILHVGTLVVVLFFFRRDVKNILLALGHLDFKSEDGRLIPLIVVATVPTAIIGTIYVKFLENSLQTILPIAMTFVIGGTLVYFSKFGKEKTENINYLVALIMGTAQGLATFHGLSRSGATISVALLLGLKREKAFKFSFLLSIPAILGALVLDFGESGRLVSSGFGWPELLAGVTVAMLVGYFALKLLWRTLATKRFHYFAFYTWLIGVFLIILSLGGFKL